eukprot:630681-Pyramimonas_sp.AAC.1
MKINLVSRSGKGVKPVLADGLDIPVRFPSLALSIHSRSPGWVVRCIRALDVKALLRGYSFPDDAHAFVRSCAAHFSRFYRRLPRCSGDPFRRMHVER